MTELILPSAEIARLMEMCGRVMGGNHRSQRQAMPVESVDDEELVPSVLRSGELTLLFSP